MHDVLDLTTPYRPGWIWEFTWCRRCASSSILRC